MPLKRALRTALMTLTAAGATVGFARAAAAPVAGSVELLGFSASAAAAQVTLERSFDASLSAAEQRAWLEQMSSAPNHVGSPHDKANAEFVLAKFREWGWDASIESFSVLYPTPHALLVEMVSPRHFLARLTEPPVAGDRTSTQMAQELPAYNVYGADGDVTADLVYVNRGMPEDYQELARQGVSVEGRIVIARYGGGWRGLKPKLAYEHGAVGCLIYSDPRDDGYGSGDTYPAGAFRPADGVQRGSVMDWALYGGDPLTPGVGSNPGAQRLAIKDAATLMKIPVLPLSYAAAEPLLAALGGRVAPGDWRGGLAITYHIGPGPAKVHLKVQSDWQQQLLFDVIARVSGAQEPDHWIMRGNHRDGWVFGAGDPLAGQIALMAEGEAIGQLLKSGWRPRRTLIYASWDGEEPGLLGSTEWAETHAAELKAKAALYINTDENGRGFLRASGTHALQRFVNQAARDVRDPESQASVLARALAAARVAKYELAAGGRGDADPLSLNRDEIPLDALGSGSDFSPFLQHLGISSINLGFGGEAGSGAYHSAYDSFDHYRRFVDPEFAYGVTLAQTSGRLVLRAAQADLLPLQAGDFANSIGGYADELHKLADSLRARTRTLDQMLNARDFALAADPLHPRAAPQRDAAVPFLDFAPLDNAVEKLRSRARAFDVEYQRVCAALDEPQQPSKNPAAQRDRLNGVLSVLEQSLTDSRGLPGRPWFQHMIFAPGVLTGYAPKTLPGIREAIELRQWDRANQYIEIVANAINAYGARLESAIATQ